ncbi:hypothetical protein EUGRSUZ_D00170 [Eucalyptus grandis]|uniref:Uncharacterized protein n=2 Tax=Eucalyptus grandis TaxID=71139 RepID=A0ACC3L2D6_EUCGR|nr:hypothetical protein EUGRSUZ_D00170 [Eucalyptus grandis]
MNVAEYGKRSTESTYMDNFNLHCFIKTAIPDRLMQFIDLLLNSKEERELEDNGNISTCLAVILRIEVISSAAS